MSALHLIRLIGAIDAAGRFNTSMLSDHQLMELLVTPDDVAQARENLKGDEDDACSWKGITCNDENDCVTQISWHSSGLKVKGEMNFAMLPPKLTRLNLYHQPLRGSMDVSHLPEKLRILCVQSTGLTGSIDFGSLPRTLEQLFITDNKIESIQNIVNLPSVIQYFEVREPNVMPKSICVGRLDKEGFVIKLQKCGITKLRLEDEKDRRRVHL